MDTGDSSSESALAWRLRVYPIGLLAALGVALVALAIAANGSDAPAQEVGGDFAAFYGAAVIAADGDWDNLYSFDRQVAAQADLQEREGSARYFAYPPQVALAHAPLAALNYGFAYLAYTGLMFAMLVAAIRLAEPMLPWLRGRTWLAAILALSFWPMLRAVTGGSNTALSLLVIVAAWRLILVERPFLAGATLSLLLAKPQLAIPLIGLMLVIGLYRVVAGATAGALAFYLVGVPLAGWQWPLDWWEVATDFNRIDSEVNGFSSVSWLGFLENALGIGDPIAVVLGWGLAALTVLGLVWLWRRGGPGRLDVLLAIAMPGILLLSPHALSHDTAIVLLSLGVLYQRNELPRRIVIPVWVLGVSMMWIDPLGFSPGFFLLLLLAWWTVTRLNPVAPVATSATREGRVSR